MMANHCHISISQQLKWDEADELIRLEYFQPFTSHVTIDYYWCCQRCGINYRVYIDARLNQCLLEFESVSKLINFTSPNDLLIAKLAQWKCYSFIMRLKQSHSRWNLIVIRYLKKRIFFGVPKSAKFSQLFFKQRFHDIFSAFFDTIFSSWC